MSKRPKLTPREKRTVVRCLIFMAMSVAKKSPKLTLDVAKDMETIAYKLGCTDELECQLLDWSKEVRWTG